MLAHLLWSLSSGVLTCFSAGGRGWLKNSKKRIFVQVFKNMSQSRKFLIVQGNFGKFIDVVRRNYVFKECKREIPDKFSIETIFLRCLKKYTILAIVKQIRELD